MDAERIADFVAFIEATGRDGYKKKDSLLPHGRLNIRPEMEQHIPDVPGLALANRRLTPREDGGEWITFDWERPW